jgi:hypothetical protein
MTPSRIEPATFQFVAQYLNHCATAVPILREYYFVYSQPGVDGDSEEQQKFFKLFFFLRVHEHFTCKL